MGCYPEVLLKRLQGLPAESVHSLVIWTKNPKNMIVDGVLRRALGEYRQLYVHLTITGMGGSEFEPLIPPWEDAVKMIPPLMDMVGDPRRISWRFDPILETEGHGRLYSNFSLFPRLAEAIAPFGVKNCRVSWVSPYKKVLARLTNKGWDLAPRTFQKRLDQANILTQVARQHGMNLFFCSMEGFPISRCVDGEFLSEIHPDGRVCSKEKARGQRPFCGCTQSLDIGWYSLQCKHGCLYCYACP